MNKPVLADFKSCTGCLACIDSCAKGALYKEIGTDGHIYVNCNTDKCVLCHRCENVCPVISNLQYSSNQLIDTLPYSAFSNNNDIYSNSTSGGIFADIAYHFIEKGGYICGAIFQNNSVRHIVSNNIEDISRIQGSKYMQSHMDSIYKDIDKILKTGKKVLFSGMGCQAAGVYSYFKKSKFRDNLFIIDIICGGVPTSLLVDTFLKNEREYSEIVGFRQKNKYDLSCRRVDDNGIEILNNKQTLPLYGFFGDLTKRYSCGDCKFCGVERLSDLTIGDYWGENSKIHKSVVLVHTLKGRKLLEISNDLNLKQIDWSFVKHNHRCVIGYSGSNCRLQRRLLSWNFKYLPYSVLKGIYGCKPKSLLWLPLNIYNIIYRKILSIKKERLLKKALKEIK